MAKEHTLKDSDCLVSNSSVIPKHVESTCSGVTAEHEMFGRTASLRQGAASSKLADPVWRAYEALRAQQVQEYEPRSRVIGVAVSAVSPCRTKPDVINTISCVPSNKAKLVSEACGAASRQ